MAMQRGSPSRKYLTDPSEGVGNQGWDNKNSDLIIAVEDVFCSKNGHRCGSLLQQNGLSEKARGLAQATPETNLPEGMVCIVFFTEVHALPERRIR